MESRINEYDKLKEVRSPNLRVIADLNTNSLRNKFEILHSFIINKVDTFSYLGSETRFVFPSNPFLMDGFSLPYWLDRN